MYIPVNELRHIPPICGGTMVQKYTIWRKAPKDAGFEAVGVFHRPFHYCGTMEQSCGNFQTPGILPPPNGALRGFLVYAHESVITRSHATGGAL